jgi:hypothetical protein
MHASAGAFQSPLGALMLALTPWYRCSLLLIIDERLKTHLPVEFASLKSYG